MDQLMCASLSHTNCWYEVGMLKVPANHTDSKTITWLFVPAFQLKSMPGIKRKSINMLKIQQTDRCK